MFENPFKAGTLVRHPAFGVGKVVAIQGDRIHVYFHGHKKWATRFGLEHGKKHLVRLPEQRHPWLDHLAPFEWNAKEGKFGMEFDRLTHEQALARFLELFPAAFEDPRYIGMKNGERAYKLARVEEWDKSFGNGEGERLLRVNDVDELTRRLLHVSQINLLHHNWDRAPLKDALADKGKALPFFEALLAAASQRPDVARFEAVARALEALPAPGSAVASWPVATIFPWLADPTEHMFFRPTPTLEAAKRLAFELNYSPDLNWRTYQSVLAFAAVLLEELRPYKAKDYLDVQGFIFVTWLPGYAVEA